MPSSAGASSSSTIAQTPRGAIRQALQRPFEVEITEDPAEAVERAEHGAFDLIMISASLKAGDGLRLCTQIRTIDGLQADAGRAHHRRGADQTW